MAFELPALPYAKEHWNHTSQQKLWISTTVSTTTLMW